MNISQVSIVICTHNRAASLASTLAAISKCCVRPDMPTELIIVDNASTDETRQVIRECVLSNMRVITLYEPMPGKSRALNRALAVATGTAILFTDDDVRPAADWVEQLASPLLSGEAMAVVGRINVPMHLRREWIISGFPSFVACNETDIAGPVSFLVGANMGCNRRLLAQLPGFDPELGPPALGAAEDLLLALQIIEAGHSIISVPAACVEHHFDASRLDWSAIRRVASSQGRSEAYLQHHWFDKSVFDWRWAWVARMTAATVLKRVFGGPGWTGVGTPQYWLIPLIMAASFLRQLRIERKRPRNYSKRHYPSTSPSH